MVLQMEKTCILANYVMKDVKSMVLSAWSTEFIFIHLSHPPSWFANIQGVLVAHTKISSARCQ